jgi:hypothetical protein
VDLSRVLSLVAIASVLSAFCTRGVKEPVCQTDADGVTSMHVPVRYDVIVDYSLHTYASFHASCWRAHRPSTSRRTWSRSPAPQPSASTSGRSAGSVTEMKWISVMLERRKFAGIGGP